MQLLIFTLGKVKYGIPINLVQSVEKNTQAIGVPNALPYIKGIINLHNNNIPLYSLSMKFGYPEQEISNIIVTDVDGIPIGFEVCKVDRILEVDQAHMIPMPNKIGSSRKYLTDVANYERDLIMLLDVKRLISIEEQKDLRMMLETHSTQKQSA